MLNYVEQPGQEFDLPAEATHFDTGADGRLYAVGVDQLWEESAPGARTFASVAVPSFGNPEFIRVSPSGRKAAVGNYGDHRVHVFDLPYSSISTISATSYDAEWFNERLLAVSNQGADGSDPPSEVTLLDTVAGTMRPVITDIPGYSGGVTFDLDGNLYTGLGLASAGGPDTGMIKAFRFNEWNAVLNGGQPLDFTSRGRVAANLLSAAFLTFDLEQNLCVGGGGGIGPGGGADLGYGAVVSHSGLRAALYDRPPIEPDAPLGLLQRLDPTPTVDNEYWLINTNPVRCEVYLRQYGNPQVIVFRQRLRRSILPTHFQMGDNPGSYPGTRFVGMRLAMPLTLPPVGDFAGPICLRLATSFVQTLGVSEHTVSLNGYEVGTMTGGYYVDSRETFDFLIAEDDAATIIGAGNPAELAVEVDSAAGPGLADDFILRSVGVLSIPT